MPVDLIPAALVHAELLAGMHKVCFAEPWSAASMTEILAMPGAAGLIAVAEGSLTPSLGGPGPAGLVLWRSAAGEAEILTIAVLPPWRRAGLGGRLLDAALAGAARDGAEAMFLEAAAGNRAALALYEGRGFAAVGRRRGYYGDDDAVVMRRELLLAHD
ncbi:MAG TPA: GNAT family N-acetyltransferase [Candidatus Omnitrophota bacterium]|nr:GNAT family N-acetyltransferase [Candidatus Omnitrophota bacterium]